MQNYKLLLLLGLPWTLAANNPGGSTITNNTMYELTNIDVLRELESMKPEQRTDEMTICLTELKAGRSISLPMALHLLPLLHQTPVEPPPHYHGAGNACTQFAATSTTFCCNSYIATITTLTPPTDIPETNQPIVHWLHNNYTGHHAGHETNHHEHTTTGTPHHAPKPLPATAQEVEAADMSVTEWLKAIYKVVRNIQ
jgi:hypothetical protein